MIRRSIARRMTWWVRLFVLAVVARTFVDWPGWVEWPLTLIPLGLAMVRPTWVRDQVPRQLAAPVRGRWTVVNSPASKVPSHGLRAYGQTYAVDILQANPPGTSRRVGWGIGMHRPETYSSFGESVYAMAPGVVVATASRQRDHRSRRHLAIARLPDDCRGVRPRVRRLPIRPRQPRDRRSRRWCVRGLRAPPSALTTRRRR